MAIDKNDEVVNLIFEAKNLSSEELVELATDLEKLMIEAREAEKAVRDLEIDSANIRSFEEMGKEVKRLEEALVESTVKYSKLRDEIKKSDKVTDEQRKALEKANIEMRRNKRLLTEQERAYKKLKDAVKPLGVTTKNVSEVQERLRKEMEQAKKKSEELNSQYKKSAGTLKEYVIAVKDALESSRKQIEAEEALAKAYREASAQVEKEAADRIRVIKKAAEAQREAAEAEAEAERERKKTAKAISLYEKELEKLNKRRRKGTLELADYIKLEDALRKTLGLNVSQIKTIKAAVEAESRALKMKEEALRKEVKARKKQREEIEKTNLAMKKYKASLESLYEELRKGNISKADFIEKEDELRRSLNLTSSQVSASKKAIEARHKEMTVAKKSTDLLTRATRRLAQAYTVLLAAQKSFEALGSAVTIYGDLEEAMVKVEKTTGLYREELVKMTEILTTMATEVTPTATNELLRYAEVAGQLGTTAPEDILKIVVAADALAVSTNMAGDEAATLLTRILKMTGEGVGEINGLASAVAHLGNNMAVTDSEVAEMAKEIATGASTLRLAAHHAAAYGAVLRELGETGERSRTAFTKLSNAIEKASTDGGEYMERLSNVTRMAGEEIRKALGEGRTNEVILAFISGLRDIEASGGNARDVLVDLGVTADESIKVIRKLSGNYDYLVEAMDGVNKAREQEDVHLKEASKQYATQNSEIGRLVNKFNDLRKAVGEALSDETKGAVDNMTDSITFFKNALIEVVELMVDVGKSFYENFEYIALVTEGIADLTGDISLLEVGMGTLKLTFNGFQIALGSVSIALLNIQKRFIELKGFFFGFSEDLGQQLESINAKIEKANKFLVRDFEDSRDAVRMMMGEYVESYEDLLDATEKYKNGVESLSGPQRKLLEGFLLEGKGVRENAEEYRRLTASIVAGERAYEVQIAQREKLKKSIEDLSKSAEDEKRVAEESLEIYDRLKEGLTTVSEEYEILKKAIDEGAISAEEGSVKMKAIVEAQRLLSSSSREASEAVKEVGEQSAMSADKLAEVIGLFEPASLAVSNLKTEKYYLMLEEANLRKELQKVNLTVEEQINLKLRLAQVERDLARTKEELAFAQQVEDMRVSQITLLYEKLSGELERLSNRYKQNAIDAGEYSEKSEVLKNKLDILKNALDGVVEVSDRASDSKARLKDRTDDLEASERNLTDAIREETNALRENERAARDNASGKEEAASRISSLNWGTPEGEEIIPLTPGRRKLFELRGDTADLSFETEMQRLRDELREFGRSFVDVPRDISKNEQLEYLRLILQQERARYYQRPDVDLKKPEQIPGVEVKEQRYVVEFKPPNSDEVRRIYVESEPDARNLVDSLSDFYNISSARIS